ncbi:ROK family protein [Streptomyces sp. NBC_01260]|uniref:ROK family protein n=1 Tax=unclassified Streptomyces TaxID=2593676 RepID=UPI000F46ED98|nr:MULTISPECIES: ROK family protein [unclassified Streptomyces]MCX4768952.1 ROK family protein [Streptomyces sp. NBC_01285]ROQ76887.1 glucokinase [Streptomyces sp. CEV 2-1]RPK40980.1 Glucokinase [Streptomyces sp. ADI92-24]
MTSPARTAPAGRPVVGLDLGGTKIAAALIGADGTVLARHSRPTPARDGATAVLDALAAAAAEADPGRSAAVLGIAAAGVIDPRTGMVTSATDSIRGWAGTALGAGLADRTGYPVACDNDVRATAGPELAALGADGREHGSLLFAAIGTGVGGAIAVDGRMLHGASGIAGHLGHLPSPEAAGLPCTCGATGHLEVIASGPGIAAHYERLTGAPVDRLETVAVRAARGDADAVSAITTGAAAVGHVLGGLANALGPDRVVVGGGVPRIGPLYEEALRAAFASELMEPLRGLVPQAPLLGHDAAVLGAAALTTTLPLHHPGALR